MALILIGYRYSVYTRVARMALMLRGLDHAHVEVDPFADPPDPALAAVNRFGRVPVLDHDGFRLCETGVITRYLARAFPGEPLIPDAPRAAARMDQVIAVMDAYGYWPMVRQVFSHAVFRPRIGAEADPATVASGLKAARPVLAQLDEIAAEGLVLSEGAVTLADLHLAPMMGYFAAAPEAAALLERYPTLAAWWARVARHPVYAATDPGLDALTPDT